MNIKKDNLENVTEFKIGVSVRLKNNGDKNIAKISSFYEGITGGVKLDGKLGGHTSWNINELEVIKESDGKKAYGEVNSYKEAKEAGFNIDYVLLDKETGKILAGYREMNVPISKKEKEGYKFGTDIVSVWSFPERSQYVTKKERWFNEEKEVIDSALYYDNSEKYLTSKEQVYEFLCNFDETINPVLITDKVVYEVKKITKILNESYSFFSINEADTWDSHNGEIMLTMTGLFEEFLQDNDLYLAGSNINEAKAKSFLINEASTDEKIKEVVDSLDDTSILLLHGLVTNKFTPHYDKKMRQVVYDHIKNNKKNTIAGRVLMDTYMKESKQISLKEAIEKFGFKEITNILESKINCGLLSREDNSLLLVKNLGTTVQILDIN